MAWFVYLIECRGGSIYTGIAVDVEKRYAAHTSGNGGHYTRAHPPQRLLAIIEFTDRSAALKAEHRIKQMTAQKKRALCQQLAEKLVCLRTQRRPTITAESKNRAP